MPKKIKAFNPFYALLVLLGVTFCLTASAYGVMAFRAIQPGDVAASSPPGRGLLEFMDREGPRLMAAQLVLLGLSTVGAIATDQFWTRHAQRRAARRHDENKRSPGPNAFW